MARRNRNVFQKILIKYRDRILLPIIRPLFSCRSGFRFVFIMLILLTCDDIESNPGTRRSDSCYDPSVCHWNLNSMTAPNFQKINLLEAYNTYIEPTSPTMLKEAVCMCIENWYLLDPIVIHIYKNVLYWKLLLITKRVMLFHCIDPLVKFHMNLTPLFGEPYNWSL